MGKAACSRRKDRQLQTPTARIRAPMYWNNGFGGFAIIVFALASLAGLRHRVTAR